MTERRLFASFPGQPEKEREDMASSCAREGLGWTLEEFFHRKSDWALERAAQGVLESPSLEVCKEELDGALGARF